MNRRSCFSRTEVTKQSAVSEVISLMMRTIWPGNRGASITMRAPFALTNCVTAFKSIASPSGIWQRTFNGIWRVIRTVRRRSGYLDRCMNPPWKGPSSESLPCLSENNKPCGRVPHQNPQGENADRFLDVDRVARPAHQHSLHSLSVPDFSGICLWDQPKNGKKLA